MTHRINPCRAALDAQAAAPVIRGNRQIDDTIAGGGEQTCTRNIPANDQHAGVMRCIQYTPASTDGYRGVRVKILILTFVINIPQGSVVERDGLVQRTQRVALAEIDLPAILNDQVAGPTVQVVRVGQKDTPALIARPRDRQIAAAGEFVVERQQPVGSNINGRTARVDGQIAGICSCTQGIRRVARELHATAIKNQRIGSIAKAIVRVKLNQPAVKIHGAGEGVVPAKPRRSIAVKGDPVAAGDSSPKRQQPRPVVGDIQRTAQNDVAMIRSLLLAYRNGGRRVLINDQRRGPIVRGKRDIQQFSL